jgi:predicted nucleotidyltransferase
MTLDAIITNFTLPDQPRQINLLRSVVEVLKASPDISSLLVRGSIAAGRSDHLSDVDLVVSVQKTALLNFLTMLDTLVRVEFGSLFPGWRDSLAPDMGGVGFVYLVPFQNVLYELDLYIISECSVPSFTSHGAIVLFTKTTPHYTDQDMLEVDEEKTSAGDFAEPNILLNSIVEILVLLHMMSKRVARQQSFIVYGHMYLVNNALRRFIKYCLAPQSPHWGWYHLEEELANDPQGSVCLSELSALVESPLVRDSSGIQHMFTRIERVIACAAPDLWSELKVELDAYRHYMGFL